MKTCLMKKHVVQTVSNTSKRPANIIITQSNSKVNRNGGE